MIRDSTLTALLMPCLDDRRFVLNDEPTDVIQLTWAEPMVPRQCHRRQPELGVLVPTYVDVHGLGAIETVEENQYGPGIPGILGTSNRAPTE